MYGASLEMNNEQKVPRLLFQNSYFDKTKYYCAYSDSNVYSEHKTTFAIFLRTKYLKFLAHAWRLLTSRLCYFQRDFLETVRVLLLIPQWFQIFSGGAFFFHANLFTWFNILELKSLASWCLDTHIKETLDLFGILFQ